MIDMIWMFATGVLLGLLAKADTKQEATWFKGALLIVLIAYVASKQMMGGMG